MRKKDLTKFKLPDSPGVYFFLGRGGKILYIGKATSLKDRVKSYFARDILLTRSPLIAKMLEEAVRVKFIKTDSVLEALILEASQIKKYQPPYNSKEKDDKSYNYITVTEESFPKVIVTRGSGTYGPFPHGAELKEALKVARRIFPFRDKCQPGQKRPCFNAQIGLCPGVCVGKISEKDYARIIRHLSLFFNGRKKALISTLKREMKSQAREQKFEAAGEIKKKIFALEHIQDVALIKQGVRSKEYEARFRIEAYDVAHISGSSAVSVMTVVEDGEPAKSEYRKFKLKNDKNDDVGNLKETLERRLNHGEWRAPNLIVVDGGQGQLNAARAVLAKKNLKIPVAAVVKDERHKPKEVLGSKEYVIRRKREILLANSEAHRFAIGYHRKLRGKRFKM
ncbi:MAG: GIY-YIG nuclease family protein [Minisyncoccia bacterium]